MGITWVKQVAVGLQQPLAMVLAPHTRGRLTLPALCFEGEFEEPCFTIFLRWDTPPSLCLLIRSSPFLSPLPVKPSGILLSLSQDLGCNLRMERTPERTRQ